jgi:hypothetical protein
MATLERVAALRPTPLTCEALISAASAAVLAAALVWLGPPGTDLAAHAYQRAFFLHQGFAFWNNFWYAGRYSFITYSVLYYPLAALLGIRLLAVATIAVATLAFAVVLGREWGPTARWSSRTFAVVWAAAVLSAAFPFALGVALALLALWALQAGSRWRFALLATLTLAASPLAFALLAIVLAGVALSRWHERRKLVVPALTIVVAGIVEVVLWRAFPDPGRYPFSWQELAAACTFCIIGAGITWRVERAGALRYVFVVYLAACLAVYLVPSSIGENIARMRFAAIPLTVLALSLRRWSPKPVVAVCLILATSWNVTPLAASFAHGESDPAAKAAYWRSTTAFLRRHLTPSYRVEAVDTTGHWAAEYLPRARVPLARGWYRQDDFPQNRVLYGDLGPRAYRAWLDRLAVRYVVLTDGPPDYSSRAESALVRSDRAGLRPVFRTRHVTIYEVPHARPLVTGATPAVVRRLTASRITIALERSGRYRVAVRYSPYWSTSSGCLSRTRDGMVQLAAPAAGLVRLRFDIDAGKALAALAGQTPRACAKANSTEASPKAG